MPQIDFPPPNPQGNPQPGAYYEGWVWTGSSWKYIGDAVSTSGAAGTPVPAGPDRFPSNPILNQFYEGWRWTGRAWRYITRVSGIRVPTTTSTTTTSTTTTTTEAPFTTTTSTSTTSTTSTSTTTTSTSTTTTSTTSTTTSTSTTTTTTLGPFNPLILTVDTQNFGDTQPYFTIPGSQGLNYYYSITWKNLDNPAQTGTIANIQTQNYQINFPVVGRYEITISGQLPRVRFDLSPIANKAKLMSIDQWGDIAWSSMSGAFTGCTNVGLLAQDSPNLSGVTNFTRAFEGCLNFLPTSLNSWNMSNAQLLNSMFKGCGVFNADISAWNTANVTSMSEMFSGAATFNGQIGSWNTANVISMRGMFKDALAFNGQISSWNTAKVENFAEMFSGAFSFNRPLALWKTGEALSMDDMFRDATAFDQSLRNWCVTYITSKPSGFDLNSPIFNDLARLPDWGTCTTSTTTTTTIAPPQFSSTVFLNSINLGDTPIAGSNDTGLVNFSNPTATANSLQRILFETTGVNTGWTPGIVYLRTTGATPPNPSSLQRSSLGITGEILGTQFAVGQSKRLLEWTTNFNWSGNNIYYLQPFLTKGTVTIYANVVTSIRPPGFRFLAQPFDPVGTYNPYAQTVQATAEVLTTNPTFTAVGFAWKSVGGTITEVNSTLSNGQFTSLLNIGSSANGLIEVYAWTQHTSADGPMRYYSQLASVTKITPPPTTTSTSTTTSTTSTTTSTTTTTTAAPTPNIGTFSLNNSLWGETVPDANDSSGNINYSWGVPNSSASAQRFFIQTTGPLPAGWRPGIVWRGPASSAPTLSQMVIGQSGTTDYSASPNFGNTLNSAIIYPAGFPMTPFAASGSNQALYARGYITNGAITKYSTNIVPFYIPDFQMTDTVTYAASTQTVTAAASIDSMMSPSTPAIGEVGFAWIDSAGTVQHQESLLIPGQSNFTASFSVNSSPVGTIQVRAYCYHYSSTLNANLVHYTGPFQSINKVPTPTTSTSTTTSTTTTLPPPIVVTGSFTFTDTTVAFTNSSASLNGGSPITARGIVWSTSANPDVSLPTKTSDGTGASQFNSFITGLSPNVTYYARAYATNSSGVTAYGSPVQFTTNNIPTVTIGTSTTPFSNKLTITNSNVTVPGVGTTPAITARGIVWSTSANPDVSLPTKTSDGTGSGQFTSVTSGAPAGSRILNGSTQYIIRAYATNSNRTYYSSPLNVTTPAHPTLTHRLSTTLFRDPATVTFQFYNYSFGISSYQELRTTASTNPVSDLWYPGVVYSLTNLTLAQLTVDSGVPGRTIVTYPTLSTDYKRQDLVSPSVSNFYTGPVLNNASRPYYTRAFLTDGTNYIYSDQRIEINIPIIDSLAVDTQAAQTGIATYTLTISSMLASPAPLINRAGLIVYPSDEDGNILPGNSYTDPAWEKVATSPQTSTVQAIDIRQITQPGAHFTAAGWVEYPYTVSGVTQTIRVYTRRAFQQRAQITASAVVTGPVPTGANLTNNSATITGNEVTHPGGGTVSARGVCYGTASGPNISGTKTTNGSGIGSFTSSITGLAQGTTYFYRAYATNEFETTYGPERSFKTLDVPTLTTTAASAITGTTATSGGNITADNGAAVTARGVCWSTSQNPTVALSTKTSDGTGTGSFTSSITGLTAGTTYYVRAYATNSVGTGYGGQITVVPIQNITLQINPPLDLRFSGSNLICSIPGSVSGFSGSPNASTPRGYKIYTHVPTLIHELGFGASINGLSNPYQTSWRLGIGVPVGTNSVTHASPTAAVNASGFTNWMDVNFWYEGLTGYDRTLQANASLARLRLPNLLISINTLAFNASTSTISCTYTSPVLGSGLVFNSRGIFWSTTQFTTRENRPDITRVQDPVNTNAGGQRTVDITNVSSGTTYYVRAYYSITTGSGSNQEVVVMSEQATITTVSPAIILNSSKDLRFTSTGGIVGSITGSYSNYSDTNTSLGYGFYNDSLDNQLNSWTLGNNSNNFGGGAPYATSWRLGINILIGTPVSTVAPTAVTHRSAFANQISDLSAYSPFVHLIVQNSAIPGYANLPTLDTITWSYTIDSTTSLARIQLPAILIILANLSKSDAGFNAIYGFTPPVPSGLQFNRRGIFYKKASTFTTIEDVTVNRVDDLINITGNAGGGSNNFLFLPAANISAGETYFVRAFYSILTGPNNTIEQYIMSDVKTIVG